MIKSLRNALLAGAAVLTTAGMASALSISGGTGATIGSALSNGNDVVAPLRSTTMASLLAGTTGYFGAEIVDLVGLAGNERYRFELFAHEAAFDNALTFGSTVAFRNSDSVGAVVIPQNGPPANVASSLSAPLASYDSTTLAFSMIGDLGAAANGSNPDASGGGAVGPNFYAVATDGGIWLFLDDAGAFSDDNHDDMVVRISVATVPLPAGAWLLGTALLGMGGVSLRRRKAA
ncbi:VPLPA-CTERM sorting domain-containing protein [Tropicimonas sp.]|uniref:VPLPA-CTERM sorting domain-containing protein n=1 Tax=Tropicimonas sp. TaxID=2067044 RepID=UPI003A8A1917